MPDFQLKENVGSLKVVLVVIVFSDKEQIVVVYFGCQSALAMHVLLQVDVRLTGKLVDSACAFSHILLHHDVLEASGVLLFKLRVKRTCFIPRWLSVSISCVLERVSLLA